MYAGEHDLAITKVRDPLDVPDDLRRHHTPRRPSRRRDDAVGAGLLTAGLHPQRVGGAAAGTGLEPGAARAVAVAIGGSNRLASRGHQIQRADEIALVVV